MKKVIAFLLAAVTAVLLAPVAFAAGNETLTVKSSADVAAVGQEIVFTVTLSDAAKIDSMALVPVYDGNIFELVAGEWLMKGAIADFDPILGDGVLGFSSPTDANGTVARFTLRVKEVTSLGVCGVGCELTLNDGQNRTLSSDTADIRVAPLQPGDIDGDGHPATMIDVAVLVRYIANWPGYDRKIILSAADLDGDGHPATMIDVAVLVRHIAGWPGYETIPRTRSQGT